MRYEFKASLGYTQTMSQERRKRKMIIPQNEHFDKLRSSLDLTPPEQYFNN